MVLEKTTEPLAARDRTTVNRTRKVARSRQH